MTTEERDNMASLNSSLIAQLAEAKAALEKLDQVYSHRGMEAWIAAKITKLETANTTKDARIKELEGLLAYGTDTDAYRRIRSRAEKAEEKLKAMREALQAIDDGYFQGTASRLDGGYSLACIARAARAPSLAGRGIGGNTMIEKDSGLDKSNPRV